VEYCSTVYNALPYHHHHHHLRVAVKKNLSKYHYFWLPLHFVFIAKPVEQQNPSLQHP
jgi:hypothetical protein